MVALNYDGKWEYSIPSGGRARAHNITYRTIHQFLKIISANEYEVTKRHSDLRESIIHGSNP